MTRWNPAANEGYALHESANDGTLRFLRAEAGPWHRVPPEEAETVTARERSRQDAHNAFVGSLRGRTLVLLGSGPMLTRFTPDLAKWLAGQSDVAVAGVNALPSIASKMWNADPSELFSFVLAADAFTVLRNFYLKWGWELLGDVPRFSKAQYFDGRHFPIRSASSPSVMLPRLYWRDSIVGAVNLACIMMAEPGEPKYCMGPHTDWPAVQARTGTARGRIILVGVEYNRYDHVFTHDDRFDLPEDPKKPWTHMDARKEGHKEISRHAREYGVQILNAAPWSLITEHEFCDFEDILSVPAELRTGITALGEPEHVGV